MIEIYIFADSHKHFSEGISEYIKRLGKTVKIQEIKPIKKGNSKQIILAETEAVREKLLREEGYKILLSPGGGNISTENLWKLLETQKNSWNKITFIIWWANGLDYSLLQNSVNLELSLGNMILPHSLAFMILLEQIYRCNEIERGSGYHK